MRRLAHYAILIFLAACAGTAGQPDSVRQLLISKYVGKNVQVVIIDLGAPSSTFDINNGAKALTWRRDSAKYATNLVIKSDERCVITMITDVTGDKIASVGEVDDSLGAFQLSYCKEQLNL